MSERVVPTEPGFWWAKYKGCETVVTEVFHYGLNPEEILIAFHPDRRRGWSRMESDSFEWIAPAEPPEAVAKLRKELADVTAERDRLRATARPWV